MESDLYRGTQLFDLSGRAAIVTGAGRGLGRSLALALAAAGADICAVARSEPEIASLAKEVEALGRRALAVSLDLTQPGAPEAMVERCREGLGRFDILVNNAGHNIRKPALEMTPEEFDSVITLNLRTAWLCARAAGAALVPQGWGRVINVSSILGTVALPGQSPYASSKGAMNQFTKVMALEWATSGVTVNAIAPTYFETEMTRPLFDDPERRRFIEERTPMGRWGKPDELAGAVIFFASDASAFITGQVLLVDGGWTIW